MNNYDYEIKKRRIDVCNKLCDFEPQSTMKYPDVKTKMNEHAQNNVIQILNCCKRR